MKHMAEILKEIQEFRTKEPLAKRKPSNRKYISWSQANPEKYEEAKKMRLAGEPVSKIAKKMGTGFETIRKSFQRDEIGYTAWEHKKIKVISAGPSCPCIYGIPCAVHTVKEGLKHLETNNKG